MVRCAEMCVTGEGLLCSPLLQFQYCELKSTLTCPNSATLCIVRGFE